MLLKLTESCSMGCLHCMSNCIPDETTHMSEDTFNKSIEFIRKYHNSFSLHTIVISGGEPTEHPKFCEYMRKLVNEFSIYGIYAPQIAICTNGLWISENFNEWKDLYNELRSLYKSLIVWQITNIPELYPKKLTEYSIKKLSKMKNVFIENTTSNNVLYPQGRTLENNLEWKAKGPKCFNIRSISKHCSNFSEVLKILSLNGKSCTPSIEYDGSLKLGESYLCPKCSTIFDSDSDIIKNIKEFKCLACKEAISNLSEMEKEILM